MNFILPSEDIFGLVPLFTEDTKFECLKFIEKCGRTCYKSEDKITDNSCIEFSNKIVKRQHLTVVEHSNLVVSIKFDKDIDYFELVMDKLSALNLKYLHVDFKINLVYIGGSLRAWMEMFDGCRIDDVIDNVTNLISYLTKHVDDCKIKFHDKNEDIPIKFRHLTVKFINDRAFSHELVRHRLCAFSQESQRYVRYDGGAVFITPKQYRISPMPNSFIDTIRQIEVEYRNQRESKIPPELARTILPNCTKTEVVTTADYDEWMHIFYLRSAAGAHPDMRESMGRIMKPIKKIFKM